MEYFNSMENILWLIWLGVGVAFLVAEFVMPAFIVIFFGVGAIIAGVTAFLAFHYKCRSSCSGHHPWLCSSCFAKPWPTPLPGLLLGRRRRRHSNRCTV